MKIPFVKYQGTGNDFVVIDQRTQQYIKKTDVQLIEKICHRRFGIGADGLILLTLKAGYDFEMIYFNADGRESSMCGNGGRCIAAFAHQLGLIQEHGRFWAIDGEHEAYVRKDDWVELKMGNVSEATIGTDHFILNTGSPHYVVFVEDLDDINVVEAGQMIRYGEPFRKDGINVNFVEKQDSKLLIGTYERGVEDETLSCGTGVTAAVLSLAISQQQEQQKQKEIFVEAKGGDLSVRFEKTGPTSFENIWLCGKATRVFEGDFLR